MSNGLHSRVIHLPNNMPYEVCPNLTEVLEFKYDDPSDWAIILDNLGYCFAVGDTPTTSLFVGDGVEMEMWDLHWVMLGKLTNMTRLDPVLFNGRFGRDDSGNLLV